MDGPACVAVCVCGKKPQETKELLPVAIECFRRQTYPGEKRLLLVTEHENTGGLLQYRNGRDVHVVGVEGSPVLGNLRNAALECIGQRWPGAYAIQWDADDVHAAERMAVQMDACVAAPGMASLLHCQLCYSFARDVGFVRYLKLYGPQHPPEGSPTPIHGTICAPVDAIRYPAQPKGEDTPFFAQWASGPGAVEIDNSPELYVRLSHGESTTGDEGVMQNHANSPVGTREMSAGNAGYLKQVLALYPRDSV